MTKKDKDNLIKLLRVGLFLPLFFHLVSLFLKSVMSEVGYDDLYYTMVQLQEVLFLLILLMYVFLLNMCLMTKIGSMIILAMSFLNLVAVTYPFISYELLQQMNIWLSTFGMSLVFLSYFLNKRKL